MKQAIEIDGRGQCAPQWRPVCRTLVVKDEIVIASGANPKVTRFNDPTAHAEIVAIREACRVLGDFQLTGCDLYTTCEPCPMCLGAIYWSRPAASTLRQHMMTRRGRDSTTASSTGEIAVPHVERAIPMIQIDDELGTVTLR